MLKNNKRERGLEEYIKQEDRRNRREWGVEERMENERNEKVGEINK